MQDYKDLVECSICGHLSAHNYASSDREYLFLLKIKCICEIKSFNCILNLNGKNLTA